VRSKLRFIVKVVRREQGQMVVFRTRRLTTPTSFVKVNNRSFVVDWSAPIYINGPIRYYVVDWDTGKQVATTGSTPHAVTPEELDTIVGTHVIREITHAVTGNNLEKLMYVIVGGIIGALTAALIMSLVYQEKIFALQEASQAVPLMGAFSDQVLKLVTSGFPWRLPW